MICEHTSQLTAPARESEMSGLRPVSDRTITLKSPREIDTMLAASQVVARTIEELRAAIAPGMRTRDLDRFFVTFACAAVTKGERLRPHEGFFDRAEKAAAAAGVAFCFLEEAIVFALSRDADCGSH